MSEKIGIGFVGVGDVAQRDYLPEFHRLADRCRLVTVMSRTPSRAAEVADQFGSARWTTDVADVMLDPEVDVVVNLTPVPAHHAVSVAAIEAGKHLYSEKPIAETLMEADEIARLAAVRGVTVVAAPSVMVFPQVTLLQKLIAEDRLGTVCSVRAAAFGGVPPWQGYRSDPTPFFARGAGPLRDMGVYPLHALVGLFGEITSVAAFARHTIDEFAVDSGPLSGLTVPVEAADDWHLTVETRAGVVADIHASFASDGGLAPEFEVLGRRGTIGISLLDVAAPLEILDAAGARHVIPVDHERASGPDHILGVEHLVDHLLGGTPLQLGVGVARHVLHVIESAERSAARATTITLE